MSSWSIFNSCPSTLQSVSLCRTCYSDRWSPLPGVFLKSSVTTRLPVYDHQLLLLTNKVYIVESTDSTGDSWGSQLTWNWLLIWPKKLPIWEFMFWTLRFSLFACLMKLRGLKLAGHDRCSAFGCPVGELFRPSKKFLKNCKDYNQFISVKRRPLSLFLKCFKA